MKKDQFDRMSEEILPCWITTHPERPSADNPHGMECPARWRTAVAAKLRTEIGKWKSGEWCDLCNAPQWVDPTGEHNCATIDELRIEVEKLKCN